MPFIFAVLNEIMAFDTKISDVATVILSRCLRICIDTKKTLTFIEKRNII